MNFEFTPTPNEYLDLATIAYRLRAKKNSGTFFAYMGYGATSIGFLLLVKRPDGGGWVGPAIILLLGASILYAIYRPFNTARWVKENERFFGPLRVEFSDDGVSSASDLYQHRFAWRYYVRWVETPVMFVFYAHVERCQFLPKRVFQNEDEMKAFRQLLHEKINVPMRAFPVEPPIATKADS